MKIGAQLYTVMEFCQNLNDFSESLKKVADIGYQYIQVSGTCKYDPSWLNERLCENGLECVITHNPADRITGEPLALAHEHDVFGCRYVGLGGYGYGDEPADDLQAFIRNYKQPAKILAENGKYLMYHNHFGEFKHINNQPIIAHLAKEFSAAEMGFTLDTYWVQVAGADPAYWLEKLGGRVPCIHLKDCKFDRQMAVIGEGNINFDRVFEKAESAGTEYMLVEQDDCYGEDPFECLKRSFNNLSAFGF